MLEIQVTDTQQFLIILLFFIIYALEITSTYHTCTGNIQCAAHLFITPFSVISHW